MTEAAWHGGSRGSAIRKAEEGEVSTPVGTWVRRFLEAVATDVTSELSGRDCLVLAPHPDDEVLACGGTISKKVQQGASVAIAFLTDGRRGIPAPPEDTRALREREARKAGRVLGLSPDSLVFLRFEDGRLGEHVSEATESVSKIVTASRVEELFVPYRREYHADHMAAWRIGFACRRNGLRVYEYPIWYGPWLWSRLGWRARMAAVSHLLDAMHLVKVRVAEVAEIKQRALAAYRSQVSAFENQGAWGPKYLANFSADYELFFVRQ